MHKCNWNETDKYIDRLIFSFLLFQYCKDEYRCLKERRKRLKKEPHLLSPAAAQQSKAAGASPTCTQSERDARYGRGWRWNTRNCSSLPASAGKQCKRAKRRHCVKKQKAAGRSSRSARARCGAGLKKRYKLCLAKLSDLPRKAARKKCKTRERRYVSNQRKTPWTIRTFGVFLSLIHQPF